MILTLMTLFNEKPVNTRIEWTKTFKISIERRDLNKKNENYWCFLKEAALQ